MPRRNGTMNKKKEIGQVFASEDEVNDPEYWVCVGYVDVEDQDMREMIRDKGGIQYAIRHLMDQVTELSRKEKVIDEGFWGHVYKELPGIDRVVGHSINHVDGMVSRKTTRQERRDIEAEFEAEKKVVLEILKGSTYICAECSGEQNREVSHKRTSGIGKEHAKFEVPHSPEAELLMDIFLKSKILETTGKRG